MTPDAKETLDRARQYLQHPEDHYYNRSHSDCEALISDLLSLCEALRGEALEEAAKVCEYDNSRWSSVDLLWDIMAECRKRIRSLKGGKVCPSQEESSS